MSASTKWGEMLQEKNDEAGAVHGEHGWWVPDADSAHPTRQNRQSRRIAVLKASAFRTLGGLAIAAVLWLLDLRHGAALLAMVVIGLSVLSVLWPVVGAAIDAGIARVAASIGRFVATVMLAIVYFFVITPVSLYLRLVGRNPLASPGLPRKAPGPPSRVYPIQRWLAANSLWNRK